MSQCDRDWGRGWACRYPKGHNGPCGPVRVTWIAELGRKLQRIGVWMEMR